MTVKEALSALKALTNEVVFARNAKNGAGKNQFGVQLGDIRRVANKNKDRPRPGPGALEN
jgi:hypothetical protein